MVIKQVLDLLTLAILGMFLAIFGLTFNGLNLWVQTTMVFIAIACLGWVTYRIRTLRTKVEPDLI